MLRSVFLKLLVVYKRTLGAARWTMFIFIVIFSIYVRKINHIYTFTDITCCCSVTKSCLTLCEPLDYIARQAPLSSTISWSLLKFTSIELVMLSNHLTLCHPLLLPSIFPSPRVFSSESTLHIRWPKYWSFSFSITPSNEYSGLVSFRIDWFDLPVVQNYMFFVCFSAETPVYPGSSLTFWNSSPELSERLPSQAVVLSKVPE